MAFNILFVIFFLMFFGVRLIVARRLDGIELILALLLMVFFVMPGGPFSGWLPDGLFSSWLKLFSNWLNLIYLVFFCALGARRRVASSMAAFAVAYVGVYCASLFNVELPIPVAVGLLGGSSVVVFLVQRGGMFFDVQAKQFQPLGQGGWVLTHFAHFEYLVFRALPALLVLYLLVPFLRHRFHL